MKITAFVVGVVGWTLIAANTSNWVSLGVLLMIFANWLHDLVNERIRNAQ